MASTIAASNVTKSTVLIRFGNCLTFGVAGFRLICGCMNRGQFTSVPSCKLGSSIYSAYSAFELFRFVT
jgi:hypothetical protein